MQSSVEAPVAAVVEPVTHLEPRLGLVARRDLRTTGRVFRVFRSGGGSHVAHLKDVTMSGLRRRASTYTADFHDQDPAIVAQSCRGPWTPSGTSLTTCSSRTRHTCVSGSRLSARRPRSSEWSSAIVPESESLPLPETPVGSTALAAPLAVRASTIACGTWGNGHPDQGGSVVPPLLDEVGQHIGRRQPLPRPTNSAIHRASGSPRSGLSFIDPKSIQRQLLATPYDRHGGSLGQLATPPWRK